MFVRGINIASQKHHIFFYYVDTTEEADRYGHDYLREMIFRHSIIPLVIRVGIHELVPFL